MTLVLATASHEWVSWLHILGDQSTPNWECCVLKTVLEHTEHPCPTCVVLAAASARGLFTLSIECLGSPWEAWEVKHLGIAPYFAFSQILAWNEKKPNIFQKWTDSHAFWRLSSNGLHLPLWVSQKCLSFDWTIFYTYQAPNLSG